MQQTYSEGRFIIRVIEGIKMKDKTLSALNQWNVKEKQHCFPFKGSGICYNCESHHHQHRCSNWLCIQDNTNYFVMREENNACFILFVLCKNLLISFSSLIFPPFLRSTQPS